jgi:DNA-binding transcriptional regulator YbjK
LTGASERDLLAVLYSSTAAYLSLTERYEPLEHSYTTHKLAHVLTALQEQLAELPLEMLQDPEAAYLPRIDDILANCTKAPAVVLDGMAQVSTTCYLQQRFCIFERI